MERAKMGEMLLTSYQLTQQRVMLHFPFRYIWHIAKQCLLMYIDNALKVLKQHILVVYKQRKVV